jgi:uncharacterized protein (TIGR03435 family)
VRRLLWCLMPLCAGLSQQVPQLAQQAPPPAFEVASLKPSPPSNGDAIYITLGAVNHGTVKMTNVTLSECIIWAYGLVSAEQVSGPVWISEREVRFDIVAKALPETHADQLRLMMRTLLAERFGLTLHSEPRRLEHLELSVDKTGPKLARLPDGAPAFPFEFTRGRLMYSRITMNTLAVLLSRQLKQMVLDNTSLPGFYDVKLEWTPDDEGIAGVDIFSAVRQQLGLNLALKKTPVEISGSRPRREDAEGQLRSTCSSPLPGFACGSGGFYHPSFSMRCGPGGRYNTAPASSAAPLRGNSPWVSGRSPSGPTSKRCVHSVIPPPT